MTASDFPAPALHGGPDALGVPLHDFSTNSNACGPCPGTWAAVQQADATRYPDPRYTALRAQLAAFHGVDPERVLVAGSASECIFRITAWAARQGVRQVQLPLHAYGDYRQAAQAWGLAVHCGAPGPGAAPQEATLSWACEPSSPLGQTPADLADWAAHCAPGLGVLDRDYAPLRLSGVPALAPAARGAVWQLFSPNKALGLTGVRVAYAIAPRQAQAAVAQLEALSPSWPLGAHAVALLASWCQADT
ncbi:MAG: aminotransferase, partial [Burkholderiaceae bacterium]|nr:aminotransferase [Burkholderiaceae bacterium]